MNADPIRSEGVSDLRRSVSGAAERIQSILDAAEQVANEIRADAERDASEYGEQRRREADAYAEQRRRETEALAEAQVKELDRVASILRDQLAEKEERDRDFVAIVTEAAESLRGGVTVPPVVPAPAPEPVAETNSRPEPVEPEETVARLAPPPSAPEPVAEREPDLPPLPADDRFSTPAVESAPAEASRESALIRATQLAVRGTERGEIERTLRDEFGVSEPSEIVNEILGRA